MGSPLTLHPKTAAAGVTGGLALVIIWLLGLAHVQVDPVVAGALATGLATFAAWLAPIIQKETGTTPTS